MVEIRGGNNRQLAKSLDQYENPTAFIDRRGQIVYVNGAMCEMAAAEASELVGQQTSWGVAADEHSQAALLTALAPPASARMGQVTVRRLTAPVVYGDTSTGQIFIPLLDSDALPHLTMVVFGVWETLARQLPHPSSSSRDHEAVLTEVRSRWQQLDGLTALLGTSDTIQLAMRRAQLAITADFPYVVTGPAQIGKGEVAKAIFAGRLKRLGVTNIAGQYFPVDCRLLEGPLVEGMLEVFAGRLRPGVDRVAQQVVLERVDLLQEASLGSMLQWMENLQEQSLVAATSRVSMDELKLRGPNWHKLASLLGTCEVRLPPLAERSEDVLPLAHLFLAESCRKADRALLTLAPEVQDQLVAFRWPRNLEQLRSTIEDAVSVAVLTSAIKTTHLPVEVRTYAGKTKTLAATSKFEPISLDEVLLEVERVILRRAIKLSPRNRAQVARWLDISRPRLLRRLAQLGLDDKKPDVESDEGD